jgi:hypothetical protein
MRPYLLSRVACLVFASMLSCQAVSAQSLGPFSWQMAPYCNIVTLNVTQNGSIFTLDGFDAQCGAARRAPVTGLASVNPDGTIGLGLTVVNTPGGEPTHVDAVIDLATLGGVWSDSGGTTGTFVFNGAGGGARRPTGQVTATKFGNTSVLLGRRANGTATAPSAVLGGQNLLLIGAQGYDGVGFRSTSARIAMVASESWSDTARGARIQFMTTENGAGGAIVRMTLDHDGRLGVGTDTPAELLDVRGDIRIGTGTLGCVRDGNGSIIAGACASDARFKRDVVSFEPMLDKVAALRPVRFHWRAAEFPARAFGETKSYGLLAQEVERLLPELVTTDAEGYKRVNYSQLPLIALQAIGELKAQHDELRKRNDDLAERNDELARRLAAIEARLPR